MFGLRFFWTVWTLDLVFLDLWISVFLDFWTFGFLNGLGLNWFLWTLDFFGFSGSGRWFFGLGLVFPGFWIREISSPYFRSTIQKYATTRPCTRGVMPFLKSS